MAKKNPNGLRVVIPTHAHHDHRIDRHGGGGNSSGNGGNGGGNGSPPLSLEFRQKLAFMRSRLAPLVSVYTGTQHAEFPRTLLQFWLLTGSQINALAEYYDQRFPGPYTDMYPVAMGWREDAGLEVKRRKFGKFIGLKGCETPVWEKFSEGDEDFWGKKWV